MRHLTLLALLAATPALVPTEAHAAPAESRDGIGENIRAEAEAIEFLVEAVRADLEADRITVADEAKATWTKGLEVWAEVKELGKAKEYGPAYKKAREARELVWRAFREAFEGKPSKETADALKAYVDAVGPRVRAVERNLENYKPTLEGRASFEVARAMYAEAVKAVKKKRWEVAYRSVAGSMNELDKVIWEVYPRSR